MTREELLEMMQNPEIGTSKLHLRSESIQNRVKSTKFPRLKKALKKKSKLLVFTEIALPFNPATGVADEYFGPDNKFRPAVSATTAALMLKATADSNEALKATLMKRAGVDSWDTSSDEFTAADRAIFVKYRVPRIFTVPVVSINIPTVTGRDYGLDYSISVNRDPITGDVIGEMPNVLKVNNLFRDICYTEIKEYDDKCASGEITHTEKQQKEYKSDIFKKVSVSDDHPSNHVLAMELPLNASYKLSADTDIATISSTDIGKYFIISKYSKELRTSIEEYVSGAREKHDTQFDYFEIDMNCPVEGEDQTNQGKMQIGLNTKFVFPDFHLDEYAGFDNVSTVLREKLDEMNDVEEQVMRSTGIRPFTPDLENKVISSLSTVLDIVNNEYVTDEVLTRNAEIVSLAFAEDGDDLIMAVEAGVSEKEAGTSGAIEESAKKYDLKSADFVDDDVEIIEDEEFTE